MKRWLCLGVMVAALAVTGCAHTPAVPGTYGAAWTAGLADHNVSGRVDDLAQKRNYQVRQVSVEAGGSGDSVIAEFSGPGCILRIWTEESQGRIAVFVDNDENPVFATPHQNLFNTELPPFETPLASTSGGGSYSYVPIPYAISCRVVYVGEGPAPAAEVMAAEFSSDAALQSYYVGLASREDRRYFQDWKNEWNAGMEVRRHDPKSEKLHHAKYGVYPRKNIQLMPMHGPATITEIEMIVGAKDPDILDKLWLVIYWDNQAEPSVLAPLSGMFGSLVRTHDAFGGPVLGRENNRMWCRFPMPFRHGAKIRLINSSNDKIDFEYYLTWREGVDPDARYFHARYNEGAAPYKAASLRGSGHYVGTVLSASGSNGLAGSTASFYIDGASAPQVTTYGMGRYFNAHWALSHGAFVRPNHGVTLREGGAQPDAAAGYRIHTTDVIPFREGLEFSIAPSAPGVRYESVSFWYQDEPASIDRVWPVPAVAYGPRPDDAPEWSGVIANWRGESDKIAIVPLR